MDPELVQRAERHAALGDPVRLAMVEDLVTSDRSPSELGARFDLPSNLLAHHLDVLERAGLVRRLRSSGDGRRRYVSLVHQAAAGLGVTVAQPEGSVLFVCTANSARSQLAAALWRRRTRRPAQSAGTHPAARIHPGAVAAAERAGLDLRSRRPQPLDAVGAADLVVTVCDRAHEELEPGSGWWHWSVPDPVEAGTDEAFDAALAELDSRIHSLTAKDPS